MTFTVYQRPCKTRITRDGFAAHVARGSVLPGLDYACNTGDKVFATADGKVIETDFAAHDARGISIRIQHPDGHVSNYLHLSIIKVKQGQHVKAGELIALSGNTGTTTTGAHLHFAIQDKQGKCIDPAKWFKQNRADARKHARAAKAVPVSETPAQ